MSRKFKFCLTNPSYINVIISVWSCYQLFSTRESSLQEILRRKIISECLNSHLVRWSIGCISRVKRTLLDYIHFKTRSCNFWLIHKRSYLHEGTNDTTIVSKMSLSNSSSLQTVARLAADYRLGFECSRVIFPQRRAHNVACRPATLGTQLADSRHKLVAQIARQNLIEAWKIRLINHALVRGQIGVSASAARAQAPAPTFNDFSWELCLIPAYAPSQN